MMKQSYKIKIRAQNSVKHYIWSFFAEIVILSFVNYFRKKTHSQVFDRVLNTFLRINTTNYKPHTFISTEGDSSAKVALDTLDVATHLQLANILLMPMNYIQGRKVIITVLRFHPILQFASWFCEGLKALQSYKKNLYTKIRSQGSSSNFTTNPLVPDVH